MLRAGVSTACLYPRVVEEALYDLALSGVSHVEIFINSHSELRRSFVDTLARLLQRFDMTCASLHPYTCEIEPNMLFSNYARRVDDYLEYCRYYFTAMQQLGAKVFVLHGNKVPAASVNKDMYFTRFRRLAELGESCTGYRWHRKMWHAVPVPRCRFCWRCGTHWANRHALCWTSSRQCVPEKILSPCSAG